MSKAFTSEETPDLQSAVRAPPTLRPGEVRYVTPEGQAALRAELVRLREEIARQRDEPGAAQSAQLADLARKLDLVAGTLAALTVLGPEHAPEGVAAFGTWVTVEDDDGQRVTWRLVGPDETDARRGLVSVHAPLGRALLGHRAGDEVAVHLPGGVRELTVIEVAARPPG